MKMNHTLVSIFLAVALVLFEGLYSTSAETCPSITNAITIEDIQHAAHASTHIYDDRLLEGDLIQGTEFRMKKIFNEELLEGGEGIRVGIADHENTRIIVYRGTDGLEQLLQEGRSVFGREKEWIVDGVSTRVLTFFYDAYQLSSLQLREYLKDPSKKYILTGHSLGGALASILALDATQFLNGSVWNNSKSCLITFGQPRVGRSQYAMVHDRLISTFRKLRFVNKADPVTRIPPLLSGWRHHSRPVYIGLQRTFGKKRGEPSIRYHAHHIHEQDQSEELKLKKNSKRLLWKTQVYWQICSKAEDTICTRNYLVNTPRVRYHFMASYLDLVSNPPEEFYISNDASSTPFKKALVDTCQRLS